MSALQMYSTLEGRANIANKLSVWTLGRLSVRAFIYNLFLSTQNALVTSC